MKYLLFISIILSSVTSCKKDNEEVEKKLYHVRYTATWQGYLTGSIYYVTIKYSIGDSTYNEYSHQMPGSWLYNYDSELNKRLRIDFQGKKYDTTASNTLNIFVNDKLEASGSDSIMYIIRK